MKKMNQKTKSVLLWILILALAWEAGATVVGFTKHTPENVMPHLYQILFAAVSTKSVANGLTASQIVLVSASQTLFRALLGFLLGTVLGFGLALLMELSGIVEKIIFPYLMLIQMIPILGMAPIILAITGDINQSRLIIAAILTFYPVATNTLAGFHSVEKEKYDLLYMYASGKRVVYEKLLIPSAIPYFFTGLKIAAPMAITASILVDTLQGDGGLGCMLSQSQKHAMSIYVFWLIVFFSAFIGVFSSQLMGMLENLLSPEKHRAAARHERMKKEVSANAANDQT
jgi:NitT/TauT family transport system permease protein